MVWTRANVGACHQALLQLSADYLYLAPTRSPSPHSLHTCTVAGAAWPGWHTYCHIGFFSLICEFSSIKNLKYLKSKSYFIIHKMNPYWMRINIYGELGGNKNIIHSMNPYWMRINIYGESGGNKEDSLNENKHLWRIRWAKEIWHKPHRIPETLGTVSGTFWGGPWKRAGGSGKLIRQ